ncbi:MAG: hypothetical protein HY059_09395 [Proteobacteria bacterium]|nr:hypothetical protein [Pseudomonadota bacterium]
MKILAALLVASVPACSSPALGQDPEPERKDCPEGETCGGEAARKEPRAKDAPAGHAAAEPDARPVDRDLVARVGEKFGREPEAIATAKGREGLKIISRWTQAAQTPEDRALGVRILADAVALSPEGGRIVGGLLPEAGAEDPAGLRRGVFARLSEIVEKPEALLGDAPEASDAGIVQGRAAAAMLAVPWANGGNNREWGTIVQALADLRGRPEHATAFFGEITGPDGGPADPAVAARLLAAALEHRSDLAEPDPDGSVIKGAIGVANRAVGEKGFIHACTGGAVDVDSCRYAKEGIDDLRRTNPELASELLLTQMPIEHRVREAAERMADKFTAKPRAEASPGSAEQREDAAARPESPRWADLTGADPERAKAALRSVVADMKSLAEKDLVNFEQLGMGMIRTIAGATGAPAADRDKALGEAYALASRMPLEWVMTLAESTRDPRQALLAAAHACDGAESCEDAKIIWANRFREASLEASMASLDAEAAARATKAIDQARLLASARHVPAAAAETRIRRTTAEPVEETIGESGLQPVRAGTREVALQAARDAPRKPPSVYESWDAAATRAALVMPNGNFKRFAAKLKQEGYVREASAAADEAVFRRRDADGREIRLNVLLVKQGRKGSFDSQAAVRRVQERLSSSEFDVVVSRLPSKAWEFAKAFDGTGGAHEGKVFINMGGMTADWAKSCKGAGCVGSVSAAHSSRNDAVLPDMLAAFSARAKDCGEMKAAVARRNPKSAATFDCNGW